MSPRHALAALVVAAATAGTFAVRADPPKSKTVRHDPENRRGISPYVEFVVKGEVAFVARDIQGAKAIFQEAIKLDPEKMLAFYRLGEAEQELGRLDEADKAWETALSKKGPDDLKAKVLFVVAALRERQQKWQGAKEAWQAYAAFVGANPKSNGFPATATERIKQIDRRVQLEADYGKVKERIAKRLADQEKEAAENAKKDKLNR